METQGEHPADIFLPDAVEHGPVVVPRLLGWESRVTKMVAMKMMVVGETVRKSGML